MADRNFNVIVLGDSLATRVAAISLAKKGERILTFSHSRPSAHPWLFLSAALEEFLGQTGGRSCLTPPLPLQVITPSTRTEIHGALPLADELKREFPSGYASIQSLLDRLETLGDRFEETVSAVGGLPVHGMKSRLRFLRAGLSHKISQRALNSPLNLLLDECLDASSREFLQALLEGLSLTSAEELTQGEAALLWRSALQPRSISASAFEAFLKQRYEQFHGETEKFDQIKELEFQGTSIAAVILKDGRRCTADAYLLGTPEVFPLLPPSIQPPDFGTSRAFDTDLREEKISPLLAPRVILTGGPLLRITLAAQGDGRITCKAQGLRGTSPSDDIVQEQLMSLFPFAPLEPKGFAAEAPSEAAQRNSSANPLPWLKAKVDLKKNLFNCCAPAVLPSLGSTGEVMLGLSCARHLIRIKNL